MRGTKIRLEEESVWVNFSYEQLPQLCYYCGCLGHPERNCEKKLSDSRNDCISEGQYGESLRVPDSKHVKRKEAGEVRGRVSEGRELARLGRVDEGSGIKGSDREEEGLPQETVMSLRGREITREVTNKRVEVDNIEQEGGGQAEKGVNNKRD